MFFKSVTVDLIIRLKSFIITVSVKILSNILGSVFCTDISIGITAVNINKGFFFKQLFFIWIYKQLFNLKVCL